jgi:hypothetical protein
LDFLDDRMQTEMGGAVAANERWMVDFLHDRKQMEMDGAVAANERGLSRKEEVAMAANR